MRKLYAPTSEEEIMIRGVRREALPWSLCLRKTISVYREKTITVQDLRAFQYCSQSCQKKIEEWQFSMCLMLMRLNVWHVFRGLSNPLNNLNMSLQLVK